MPLCTSQMFGTSRRTQHITKVNKSGSISKDTDNNSGTAVTVDQLHSDQPVLVPQLSVKITSARIWSYQVIMGHFIDLTCMHLIISTIQEETLAVKVAF